MKLLGIEERPNTTNFRLKDGHRGYHAPARDDPFMSLS